MRYAECKEMQRVRGGHSTLIHSIGIKCLLCARPCAHSKVGHLWGLRDLYVSQQIPLTLDTKSGERTSLLPFLFDVHKRHLQNML